LRNCHAAPFNLCVRTVVLPRGKLAVHEEFPDATHDAIRKISMATQTTTVTASNTMPWLAHDPKKALPSLSETL
jgi:hypothetical protein